MYIYLRKSKINVSCRIETIRNEKKKRISSKLSKKQPRKRLVAHEDIPWKGSEQSSAPRCSRKGGGSGEEKEEEGG